MSEGDSVNVDEGVNVQVDERMDEGMKVWKVDWDIVTNGLTSMSVEHPRLARMTELLVIGGGIYFVLWTQNASSGLVFLLHNSDNRK